MYFASLITGDKYIENKIKKAPRVTTLRCLFHHSKNLFPITSKYLYSYNLDYFSINCI